VPHVFDFVAQLNLFGNRYSVLSHLGCTELLVKNDIAALGTQGNFDSICQLVNALLESIAGFDVKLYFFGIVVWFMVWNE
jgi:hypothetical protein